MHKLQEKKVSRVSLPLFQTDKLSKCRNAYPENLREEVAQDLVNQSGPSLFLIAW